MVKNVEREMKKYQGIILEPTVPTRKTRQTKTITCEKERDIKETNCKELKGQMNNLESNE
jgi:hypothetical protein